jgi:hypothetical protein
MSETVHSSSQQIIDTVLPTYRMEPEEHERFYPSVAKAMTDRILGEELSGQTYDEEEAKIWGLNISDKVREAIYGNFTAQMLVTKLAMVL